MTTLIASRIRAVLAAVFGVLLALVCAGALVPVPSAEAAGRVTVANGDGQPVADPTYATTVTVSGRGFQSVKGGHGGIYVLFGTVQSGWQPSKGGKTGQDYYYVPDSESRNNAGYQRFVAFPGGDTAATANGGLIAADGSWSTEMVIPGTTFQAVDRNGEATEIDCTKVTCGIITIGAHGLTNANNETFTPIRFENLHEQGDPESDEDTSTEAAPTTTEQDDSGAPVPNVTGAEPAGPAGPTGPAGQAPAKRTKPVLRIDQDTAVVGRVLAFTGSGFTPGEQVVATFDDGLAAVGPLTAGPLGEIAGVLQLPAETTTGTHVLKLSGAASGAKPEITFAVVSAEPAAAAAAPEGSGSEEERAWLPFAFAGLGLAALVTVLIVALVRRRRTSRVRRAEVAHAI